MPEIVWKQGAENDLLHIFADLEDRSEGTGERFVQKLDFTLEHLRVHPEIAPLFEEPMRRLVIGSTGYGLFYSVEARGIIVHALIHLSKDPEAIREKIRRLLRLGD
jgi:plasmid stabilization system protein ParE